MVKGKSSASSATRKKHARKAAAAAGGGGGAAHDEPPQHPKDKQAKTKEKGSKKSGKKDPPRKKVYIPPAKPVPARLDPLDTLGIAHIIPVDLLVVLRRLAKKDTVTKRRALEDLLADWVERARLEADKETLLEQESEEHQPLWRLHAILDALPVWVSQMSSSSPLHA
jgi:E3 ubiquitin-protein ligase listerin